MAVIGSSVEFAGFMIIGVVIFDLLTMQIFNMW